MATYRRKKTLANQISEREEHLKDYNSARAAATARVNAESAESKKYGYGEWTATEKADAAASYIYDDLISRGYSYDQIGEFEALAKKNKRDSGELGALNAGQMALFNQTTRAAKPKQPKAQK